MSQKCSFGFKPLWLACPPAGCSPCNRDVRECLGGRNTKCVGQWAHSAPTSPSPRVHVVLRNDIQAFSGWDRRIKRQSGKINCWHGRWGRVGRGRRGGGPSASDVTAIYFRNFHKHATFTFLDSTLLLQGGLTGRKPVCHHHHHRYDEDEVPSDLPGEEHAASPAGLPLLSFIPFLPPSPPTSL